MGEVRKIFLILVDEDAKQLENMDYGDDLDDKKQPGAST
jgi:hypothetical protein